MPASRRKKNNVNSFAPRKFEDHTIVDSEGYRIGHVRVKPSGILWKPKDGKRWYRASLAQFRTFMENKKTKQKK